jgi:hypothetical protein
MNKIISSRVVGSANPFAKFFRGLADSIKGIATGILFIIISFVLVFVFANQKEHSKVIADLPLQTPAEVSGVEGMVKIHGVPDYSNVQVAPNTDKDVLYYSYQEEEYAVREVQHTTTREENGKVIEETSVTYEPSWKTVTDKSKTVWSEFKLGPIEISPENAKLQMNQSTLYTNTEELEYPSYLDPEDLVEVVQKIKVTITGVEKGGELIVVGTNSNNRISSGDEGTFFVSNKSESEFVADQVKSEKTTFWIMVFVTWLLMTSGFTMLLGPITKILDIIPGVGSLASSLLFMVFGVISALIIFVAYVGIKYWWAIALILLIVVAFFIYKALNKNTVTTATDTSGVAKK